MPDEAMRLGRDVAILINPDDKPHRLLPVDYWDLPEEFEGLRGHYPYLYWNPPLKWDANPYRASQKLPSQAPVRSTAGVPELPQIWGPRDDD